ncbi:MAG: hypothetical protein HOP14_02700 [Acidobacteria bacterium]|nr:hypothetical protein [Acidobacteriota bacterium]
MSVKRFVWMLVALPLWTAAPAQAQQAPFNPFIPNPTPGCTSDPAEMEANKKVAIAFRLGQAVGDGDPNIRRRWSHITCRYIVMIWFGPNIGADPPAPDDPDDLPGGRNIPVKSSQSRRPQSSKSSITPMA